jgi:uncharacterized protein YacL
MHLSLSFIRILFVTLSVLVTTTYAVTIDPTTASIVTGVIAGILFGLTLIGSELLFQRWDLRTFNTAILGLGVGYFMGEAIMMILHPLLLLNTIQSHSELPILIQSAIFLCSGYLGMVLTARAVDEFCLSIPFIKFKASSSKKKDILIELIILMDSRILDLASSGLLDGQIIMPRFMVKELYTMLDSSDEATKSKARRGLDVLKKMEGIPSLEMRYSDVDFPEIKDLTAKLIQLAHHLDANIMTTDASRLQQCTLEGIRVINIHMLSHALKPINGEQLAIKIQRYGKEPRQGVGYLDDGTMVVVNGGAEYLGETIKAYVLSIKTTTSGRMIFCNAAEEEELESAMDLATLGRFDPSAKQTAPF